MVAGPCAALAISNFLRQHDLGQVQWVFLSSGLAGTPQRDNATSNQRVAQVQEQSAEPEPAPLRFPGLLVIVGGGFVDFNILRLLKSRGAKLVGADGGGDVIAAAGLTPDAIIGDFDSLRSPVDWLGRTQLLRVGEQETTDFDKALRLTEAPVTVAMGMTGRRFDHTLAALDSLVRCAARRRIILVDEHDIALALSGKFAFAVAPGERVSVHALQPVTFAHSEGLKYPLHGLRLGPGLRGGTSNEAVTGDFSIEPKPRQHGVWLLILELRNLLTLIGALDPDLRPAQVGD